ncbi:MAG: eCIS core domain-containing protein [Ginsengibacter sp.]
MKQTLSPPTVSAQLPASVVSLSPPQNNLSAIQLQRILLQIKLSVGTVDAPLEHDANAMADKVMRMPEQNFVQRKCAHCEEEERAQRKPSESFLQKKETADNQIVSDTVSNQIQSTKGSGNVMPDTTKSFMESRFGADFSNVKVHTGNYASQLSKELNAQAFTVGNDIYFNEGKYQPESSEGKHLLAHELTHTLQQGQVSLRKIQKQDDDVVSESEEMRDRFREERRRDLHRIIECNAFHKIRRDCPASTGIRLLDVLAGMRTRIAGNRACLQFFRSRFNINPDIMFDPSRRPSVTFDPNLTISGRTRCPEPTCDSPIPSVSIGNICNSPHLERVIMHELTHYAHCYRRWGDTGDEATSEQASNICIGTVQQALDAARGRTPAVQPKLMRTPEQNFIQRKCAHCEAEEKMQHKNLAPFIQKKNGHEDKTNICDISPDDATFHRTPPGGGAYTEKQYEAWQKSHPKSEFHSGNRISENQPFNKSPQWFWDRCFFYSGRMYGGNKDTIIEIWLSNKGNGAEYRVYSGPKPVKQKPTATTDETGLSEAEALEEAKVLVDAYNDERSELISRAKELKDIAKRDATTQEYSNLYYELQEKQNGFSETQSYAARVRFPELWQNIKSQQGIETMQKYNDTIEGFFGFDTMEDLPLPPMPDYEPIDYSGGK